MTITSQNPSIPERRSFTGPFCLPEPSALSGRFSTTAITVSITSITRGGLGGTIATATASANHNLADGDFITISGADQPEYNGIKKVIVTGLTTFTFVVSNSATTPATGILVGSNVSGTPGCAAVGVGTKALSEMQVGDFIYVESLNVVRQISLIHNDTNWEFSENFPSDVNAQPVLRTVSGLYRTASFENVSESEAGVLQGFNFSAGKVESFADPAGLGPITGDASDTQIDVSLQRVLGA